MLEEERRKIDLIDQQLVKLLEERMGVVREVANIKQKNQAAVLDEARETIVLEKVAAQVHDTQFKEPIVAIYKKMLAVSREYQQTHQN